MHRAQTIPDRIAPNRWLALAGLALGLGLSQPPSTHAQSAVWLPQNASSGTIYYSNGPVGIGTNAPAGMLDVRGAQWPLFGPALNLTGYDHRGGTNGLVKIQNNSSWTNTLLYLRHIATDANADAIRFDDTAGDQKLAVKQNGRVGIGTGSPTVQLHVVGAPGTLLKVDPASGLISEPAFIVLNGRAVVGYDGALSSALLRGESGKGLVFQTNGANTRAVITSAGLVGIGTTAPVTALTVKGTITAGDVTVSSAWADHVFEKGYELMPLHEVGQYIEKNGRLPGVPSAAEVAERGVSVSQTQVKLLEKVEELTLHAIELGRQNEKLRADNLKLREELEQRTAALEERLAQLERH